MKSHLLTKESSSNRVKDVHQRDSVCSGVVHIFPRSGGGVLCRLLLGSHGAVISVWRRLSILLCRYCHFMYIPLSDLLPHGEAQLLPTHRACWVCKESPLDTVKAEIIRHPPLAKIRQEMVIEQKQISQIVILILELCWSCRRNRTGCLVPCSPNIYIIFIWIN